MVYLVYEDGSTQSSPSRLTGLVEGAVVGNYHHVDVNAMVTGLLSSQSEVEAVAGVVLHDEEGARGTLGERERNILIYLLLLLINLIIFKIN